MKKRFYFLLSIAVMAVAAGCKDSGKEDNGGVVEGQEIKVPVTMISSVDDLKSSWFSGDKIRLFSDKSAESTVLQTSGTGKSVDFEGKSIAGDVFYAFYPSSEEVSCDGTSLKFTVPANVSGNIAGNFPMAGYGNLTDGLVFNYAMAPVAVTIKGNTHVMSLTVEATDASGTPAGMSGEATLTFNGAQPIVKVKGNSTVSFEVNKMVTGTETIYVYAPAGSYKTLTITLMDADGEKVAENVSDAVLGVSDACHVTIEHSSKIDLSAEDLSNCYVVSAAGEYKFAAKKIDGTQLTGTAADYLWTSVECNWTPEDDGYTYVTGAVEPMNQEWVVSDVVYDKSSGEISFKASGNVGNAVIALYSETSGIRQIVWTWHIWSTGISLDQMKVEHWQSKHLVNEDKELTWLDRNVGALNTLNTDNAGILGTQYQWGRKDPFPGANNIGIGTLKEGSSTTFDGGFGVAETEPFTTATMPWKVNEAFGTDFTYLPDVDHTVAEMARIPMTMTNTGGNWASDITVDIWGDGLAPFDTWKGWAMYNDNADEKETYETTRKAAIGKSNQDPCPPGYRVPTCEELWNSFAGWVANGYTEHWGDNISTGRSKRNYGRMLHSYTDPENIKTRIPCDGYREGGKIVKVGEAAYYWTSTVDPVNYANGKLYGFRWLVGSNLRIEGCGSTAIARPVRCVAIY
ncbi:MAG: hypothetical protein ACI3ZS_05905 [Candidatus Cryptobacteroides sp.]